MKLNIHDCEQARQTMDLLSNGSPALDKSELARHLRVCRPCAREYSAREQIKSLLKRAFDNSPPAPEGLRLLIENLIRSEA